MSFAVPNALPRLVITEQPKQRGMRFRYECEGRSAGSIPGENTTPEKKTWPTCMIKNYTGKAVVRISLVSKDEIPKPHPHSLVGKDCENGICKVNVGPDTHMQAVFSNLGIQCVKRKEVKSAIRDRQNLGVDPFHTANGDDTGDIDLNIVRLCFEAFLLKDGHLFQALPPEVSVPIYDKKATSSALLRICRFDRSRGSCKGGDEVYLLCDKVQKEDIAVIFYEPKTGWEAAGEFSPSDVHRQVAIVFKTPPYRTTALDKETVEVKFQLRRPSDGETSDSKTFTYLAVQHGSHKRYRTSHFQDQDNVKDILKNKINEKGRPNMPHLMPAISPYPQRPQIKEEKISTNYGFNWPQFQTRVPVLNQQFGSMNPNIFPSLSATTTPKSEDFMVHRDNTSSYMDLLKGSDDDANYLKLLNKPDDNDDNLEGIDPTFMVSQGDDISRYNVGVSSLGPLAPHMDNDELTASLKQLSNLSIEEPTKTEPNHGLNAGGNLKPFPQQTTQTTVQEYNPFGNPGTITINNQYSNIPTFGMQQPTMATSTQFTQNPPYTIPSQFPTQTTDIQQFQVSGTEQNTNLMSITEQPVPELRFPSDIDLLSVEKLDQSLNELVDNLS